jgi:hypothetical protein
MEDEDNRMFEMLDGGESSQFNSREDERHAVAITFSPM